MLRTAELCMNRNDNQKLSKYSQTQITLLQRTESDKKEQYVLLSVHPLVGTAIDKNTIALSTFEAENLSASHALQETQWTRLVLFDIKPAIGQLTPTPFHVHN